ncbi:MAG: hypothetical protein H3C30_08240 [Candidatus Hydrogenedentes bacterium]|nr:hypothetical protein [Candidatus Hydrogenedentota bacterium]
MNSAGFWLLSVCQEPPFQRPRHRLNRQSSAVASARAVNVAQSSGAAHTTPTTPGAGAFGSSASMLDGYTSTDSVWSRVKEADTVRFALHAPRLRSAVTGVTGAPFTVHPSKDQPHCALSTHADTDSPVPASTSTPSDGPGCDPSPVRCSSSPAVADSRAWPAPDTDSVTLYCRWKAAVTGTSPVTVKETPATVLPAATPGTPVHPANRCHTPFPASTSGDASKRTASPKCTAYTPPLPVAGVSEPFRYTATPPCDVSQETVSVCVSGVNTAPTDLFPSISSVSGLVVPERSPVQPVNWCPPGGVAVSVTSAPSR